MADFEERTEQATPRKLEKARQEGKVPKSKELTGAASLMGALVYFALFGPAFWSHMTGIVSEGLRTAGTTTLAPETVRELCGWAFEAVLRGALPPLVFAAVAGLLAHLIQVNFLFTFKPLEPKLEKLDPIKGLKRLFSPQTLAETVKGVFKALFLGWVLYVIIRNRVPALASMAGLDIETSAAFAGSTLVSLLLASALLFAAFGAADYGFQRWQFTREQRMTRHEVKEETKEMEGDPLIRARIRSLRREMARRRMMAEVPKADVVLTNPTHLAVALRYESSKSSAPRVVAKGAGWLAGRIREEAEKNRVPVMEDKPLARALYRLDVGELIPEDLFKAVARILAYVYKLRGVTPKAVEA